MSCDPKNKQDFSRSASRTIEMNNLQIIFCQMRQASPAARGWRVSKLAEAEINTSFIPPRVGNAGGRLTQPAVSVGTETAGIVSNK
jgi:hypothetical protein